MKKYILLGIPIIFFNNSILYLEGLINLIIILSCMLFLLKNTKLRKTFDWIVSIFFSIYLCILYSKTIFLKGLILVEYTYSLEQWTTLGDTVNLIPIKSILDEIINHPSALYQILGNTFMLTPFAFTLLYFNWAKNSKQAIGYLFIITVGIEFLQLLLNLYYTLFGIGMRRSVDIDDVILNTIGAGIGVGIYYLWERVVSRYFK